MKKFNKTDEIKTVEQLLSLDERDIKIYYLAIDGFSLKEITKIVNGYDEKTPSKIFNSAKATITTQLKRWGLKKSKSLNAYYNPNFSEEPVKFMEDIDKLANIESIARKRYYFPEYMPFDEHYRSIKAIKMFNPLYEELKEVSEEQDLLIWELIEKYCLEGLDKEKKVCKRKEYSINELLTNSEYTREMAEIEVEKGIEELEKFIINRLLENGLTIEEIREIAREDEGYLDLNTLKLLYQYVRYLRKANKEINLDDINFNTYYEIDDMHISKEDILMMYYLDNNLIPKEDENKYFSIGSYEDEEKILYKDLEKVIAIKREYLRLLIENEVEN